MTTGPSTASSVRPQTPTLFIHVGTQKTGSSSIQHFLRENENLLRESGTLFLTSVREWSDHNALAWELRSRAETSPRAEAIIDEIRSSRYERYILSAESLFHEKVPAKLYDLLTRHLDVQVKIITYLRRPDHLMEALFKQRVKAGDIKPWPKRYLNDNQFEYDYLKVLDLFDERFGRDAMIVRPYARKHLKGGDIVEDFLDATGITFTGTPVRTMPEDNPTFSSAVSELMGFCVRNSNIQFYDLNEQIAKLDWPNLKQSGDTYDRETRLALMTRLEADLHQIADKFGADLWDVLSFDDLKTDKGFHFPSAHERSELALQAGKAVIFAMLHLKKNG